MADMYRLETPNTNIGLCFSFIVQPLYIYILKDKCNAALELSSSKKIILYAAY